MNILASCVGRRGYLLRALREHLRPGERIVGTSNTRWTPGFLACDDRVLLPDIGAEGYAEAVLEVVEQHRIGALLSFFDPDIDALAPHRDAFAARGVAAFLPSAEVSRACFDKAATTDFLRARGFRAPTTWTTADAALAAVSAGDARFPLVVKARLGFGSRHLSLARTELQLRAFAEAAGDAVIQERLGGVEHSFDILDDLDGRCVRAVVKRKEAMRAGETDQAVTVRDAHLEALAFRLGDALDHRGPMDVDLFVDRGEATILEVNPRFGGGYPASHLAGADFPALVVAMARGERPAPRPGDYAPGVVMIKEIEAVRGDALLTLPTEDRRA